MRYSIIAEDNRKAEIKKFVREFDKVNVSLVFLTPEDTLRIIKTQHERFLKKQDYYMKRRTIDKKIYEQWRKGIYVISYRFSFFFFRNLYNS